MKTVQFFHLQGAFFHVKKLVVVLFAGVATMLTVTTMLVLLPLLLLLMMMMTMTTAMLIMAVMKPVGGTGCCRTRPGASLHAKQGKPTS